MMPVRCVDYDFYANVFLGRAIEPENFQRLAARAGDFVDGLCQGKCGSVPDKDRDLLRFAICAVAEIIQKEELLEDRSFAAGNVLASETVGNYSVSYGNRSISSAETGYLEKKKRDAVCRYLSAVPALKNLFCVRSFLCTHHIR